MSVSHCQHLLCLLCNFFFCCHRPRVIILLCRYDISLFLHFLFFSVSYPHFSSAHRAAFPIPPQFSSDPQAVVSCFKEAFNTAPIHYSTPPNRLLCRLVIVFLENFPSSPPLASPVLKHLHQRDPPSLVFTPFPGPKSALISLFNHFYVKKALPYLPPRFPLSSAVGVPSMPLSPAIIVICTLFLSIRPTPRV